MRRTPEDAARTRQAILAAALESFADRGWDATSFVGVGSRAGVTRGAVHHYFPDKEALLSAALSESWDDAVGPLLHDLADTTRDGATRLVGFLSSYALGLATDERFRRLAVVSTVVAPQAVRLSDGLAAKQASMSAWESAFREVLDGVRLRPGVSADAAVLALTTAIHGLTVMAASQRALLPTEPDAATALATACIRGAVV
ncbi:TetR/AcrR family transcriptional regulator [Cellulosimicrobium cellulans]|uniref:TetR/AcrR family transcriptional regulator n=1 Tax=Cellulosimicrobium cellulans TaxID=1710 RepID=UPI001BA7E531|nr:TetR/AcrR family transcriptional regulator [Cellulosimicrobium cellulans]QUB99521.1 TetR/AcrR family transcriptional regulator [Cellulosimicrobium cellulans]